MESRIGSIVCENDLDIYEKNLRNMKNYEYTHKNSCEITDSPSLKKCLINAKGKLVRVHTVSGNCRMVGILLEVGTDFITLRIGNAPASAVVPLCQVDFVTVIHNNDRRMMSRYY